MHTELFCSRLSQAWNSAWSTDKIEYGLWRSLVAHLTGGQGVAGSNPVNPTDIR